MLQTKEREQPGSGSSNKESPILTTPTITAITAEKIEAAIIEAQRFLRFAGYPSRSWSLMKVSAIQELTEVEGLDGKIAGRAEPLMVQDAVASVMAQYGLNGKKHRPEPVMSQLPHADKDHTRPDGTYTEWFIYPSQRFSDLEFVLARSCQEDGAYIGHEWRVRPAAPAIKFGPIRFHPQPLRGKLKMPA